MKLVRWSIILLAFVAAGSLVLTAGCGKKPQPTTEIERPAEPPPPPPPAPEPPREVETPREIMLQDIFFDYDKSNIREDARQTLEANGKELMSSTDVRVTLEGHCDERGTVEYNLALGERRAQSAKNWLVEFGVDASRLSTVSYGEERPFAQGSNEQAWSQNRRVHFVKQ